MKTRIIIIVAVTLLAILFLSLSDGGFATEVLMRRAINAPISVR